MNWQRPHALASDRGCRIIKTPPGSLRRTPRQSERDMCFGLARGLTLRIQISVVFVVLNREGFVCFAAMRIRIGVAIRFEKPSRIA